MDEPDARIELGKSGDALLDARHADEDHTGGALASDTPLSSCMQRLYDK